MKVTALCLVGAVLAALLKKSSPELALLLALAACAAVLLALVRGVETVTAFVREVMQWGGVESGAVCAAFQDRGHCAHQPHGGGSLPRRGRGGDGVPCGDGGRVRRGGRVAAAVRRGLGAAERDDLKET